MAKVAFATHSYASRARRGLMSSHVTAFATHHLFGDIGFDDESHFHNALVCLVLSCVRASVHLPTSQNVRRSGLADWVATSLNPCTLASF